MKVCLVHFDSSNCHYFMNDTKLSKEQQVEICTKNKCEYGSVTEKNVNGEKVLIVSCDCTWNPFDNREFTTEEKAEML